MNKQSPLFAPESITVRDALTRMDKSSRKILIIVTDDHKLIGTLSDGDIRRAILKGADLHEEIGQFINRSPLFLYNYYNPDTAKSLMLNNKIEVIPVINSSNEVIDILIWSNLFKSESSVIESDDLQDIPVVIMAGGKGTRLDPFTRVLPKPLIPIGDKTIIELIMDKFLTFGARNFFLTLNYKAEIIRSYFEELSLPIEINYIKEDTFLGTAGSLTLLPQEIEPNFFVSNCDIIVDADYSDLYQYHVKHDNDLTMVGSMHKHVIPYGIIHFSDNGVVKKIVEKPEHNLTINTGVYVVKKSALELIPHGEFFHITHLIEKLMEQGRKVGVYPVSESSFVDIGQWEEYQNALKKLQIF